MQSVEDLVWIHQHAAGRVTRFHCFLTADGKGMQSMNFREGRRCWTCDADVDSISDLAANPHVPSHVRYGAFLPNIPPRRRVGDYVHASCRILNAIFKRLTLWASSLPNAARVDLTSFIASRVFFYHVEEYLLLKLLMTLTGFLFLTVWSQDKIKRATLT